MPWCEKVIPTGKFCVCNWSEKSPFLCYTWFVLGFPSTSLGYQFLTPCMTFTPFSNCLSFSYSSGFSSNLPSSPTPCWVSGAFLLRRLPFLALPIWRPFLSSVWWQIIYSPSLLLKHEPVCSPVPVPLHLLYVAPIGLFLSSLFPTSHICFLLPS